MFALAGRLSTLRGVVSTEFTAEAASVLAIRE
jgi:hypothetical protein